MLLTNPEALKRIEAQNKTIVPVAYEVLRNYLPKDSLISLDTLSIRLDERFSAELIEMLVKECPEYFTLIHAGNQNKYFLKRIN